MIKICVILQSDIGFAVQFVELVQAVLSIISKNITIFCQVLKNFLKTFDNDILV